MDQIRIAVNKKYAPMAEYVNKMRKGCAKRSDLEKASAAMGMKPCDCANGCECMERMARKTEADLRLLSRGYSERIEDPLTGTVKEKADPMSLGRVQCPLLYNKATKQAFKRTPYENTGYVQVFCCVGIYGFNASNSIPLNGIWTPETGYIRGARCKFFRNIVPTINPEASGSKMMGSSTATDWHKTDPEGIQYKKNDIVNVNTTDFMTYDEKMQSTNRGGGGGTKAIAPDAIEIYVDCAADGSARDLWDQLSEIERNQWMGGVTIGGPEKNKQASRRDSGLIHVKMAADDYDPLSASSGVTRYTKHALQWANDYLQDVNEERKIYKLPTYRNIQDIPQDKLTKYLNQRAIETYTQDLTKSMLKPGQLEDDLGQFRPTPHKVAKIEQLAKEAFRKYLGRGARPDIPASQPLDADENGNMDQAKRIFNTAIESKMKEQPEQTAHPQPSQQLGAQPDADEVDGYEDEDEGDEDEGERIRPLGAPVLKPKSTPKTKVIDPNADLYEDASGDVTLPDVSQFMHMSPEELEEILEKAPIDLEDKKNISREQKDAYNRARAYDVARTFLMAAPGLRRTLEQRQKAGSDPSLEDQKIDWQFVYDYFMKHRAQMLGTGNPRGDVWQNKQMVTQTMDDGKTQLVPAGELVKQYINMKAGVNSDEYYCYDCKSVMEPTADGKCSNCGSDQIQTTFEKRYLDIGGIGPDGYGNWTLPEIQSFKGPATARDKAIVKLIRAGNPAGEEMFVREYYNLILSNVRRGITDELREEAEDIAHTVIMKAIRDIRKPPEEGGFKGHSTLWRWLQSIIRNTRNDFRAKKQRQVGTVSLDAPMGGGDSEGEENDASMIDFLGTPRQLEKVMGNQESLKQTFEPVFNAYLKGKPSMALPFLLSQYAGGGVADTNAAVAVALGWLKEDELPGGEHYDAARYTKVTNKVRDNASVGRSNIQNMLMPNTDLLGPDQHQYGKGGYSKIMNTTSLPDQTIPIDLQIGALADVDIPASDAQLQAFVFQKSNGKHDPKLWERFMEGQAEQMETGKPSDKAQAPLVVPTVKLRNVTIIDLVDTSTGRAALVRVPMQGQYVQMQNNAITEIPHQTRCPKCGTVHDRDIVNCDTKLCPIHGKEDPKQSILKPLPSAQIPEWKVDPNTGKGSYVTRQGAAYLCPMCIQRGTMVEDKGGAPELAMAPNRLNAGTVPAQLAMQCNTPLPQPKPEMATGLDPASRAVTEDALAVIMTDTEGMAPEQMRQQGLADNTSYGPGIFPVGRQYIKQQLEDRRPDGTNIEFFRGLDGNVQKVQGTLMPRMAPDVDQIRASWEARHGEKLPPVRGREVASPEETQEFEKKQQNRRDINEQYVERERKKRQREIDREEDEYNI